MDIAFPALAILLLSFPGILFFIGWYGATAKPKDFVAGFEDVPKAVAGGILVALVIHVVAFELICWIQPHWPSRWGTMEPVNLQVALDTVGGGENDPNHEEIFENLADHFLPISGYILFTSVIGFSSGGLLRWLNRALRLDVKYEFFRVQSPWLYYFSGADEMAALLRKQYGRVSWWKLWRALNRYECLCYVSLLLDTERSGMIVNGVVWNYELDEDDQLERIVLTRVSRMKIPKTDINTVTLMSQDEALVKKLYPNLGYVVIRDGQFVVPYESVKNMNAVFLFTEREREGAGREGWEGMDGEGI